MMHFTMQVLTSTNVLTVWKHTADQRARNLCAFSSQHSAATVIAKISHYNLQFYDEIFKSRVLSLLKHTVFSKYQVKISVSGIVVITAAQF